MDPILCMLMDVKAHAPLPEQFVEYLKEGSKFEMSPGHPNS
jgi:hypothetical protein